MSQPPQEPAPPAVTPAGTAARPEPAQGRQPDRVLIGIVAAIVVLVAVALAVVFLRGEPRQLDPASPAGVVQSYSKAVIDADPVAADAYLTDNVRSRCANFYGNAQASRVVLLSTTERGETATVRVSIVHTSEAGPFGPSEYAEEGAVVLVKVAGKWMINDLPYSLQSCTGGVLKK